MCRMCCNQGHNRMNFDLVVHIIVDGPDNAAIYFKDENDKWYNVGHIDSIQIKLSANNFVPDIMMITSGLYLQKSKQPPLEGITIELKNYFDMSQIIYPTVYGSYIRINGKPATYISELVFSASASNQSGFGYSSLYIKTPKHQNWIEELPDWVQVDIE